MVCRQCVSNKLKVFRAELTIQFPDREGLNKPPVLVFPKLMVCLDCGLTEFQLLAEQLAQLKDTDLPGNMARILPEVW
jgi:hypothetical protein